MATTLLDLLEAATAEDLAEIDKELDQIEAKAASLKMLRRVIGAKLKLPTRAKRGGVGKDQNGAGLDQSGRMNDHRRTMLAYLLHSGPTSSVALAAAAKIDGRGVHRYLNHGWFRKQGQQWVLTEAGRQAAVQQGLKNGDGD